MKEAFDTAAIAVFSTCRVQVIFFHSLPSRVGCSFQGKLFSIFKLLCLVFVRYYFSSRTALENCVLFVIALSVDCTGELIISALASTHLPYPNECKLLDCTVIT